MQAQREQWLEEIRGAGDLVALKQVESDLLGKKGKVLELVKSVPSLPKKERPAAGRAANELKRELETAFGARRAVLEQELMADELSAPDFDPTEPGTPLPQGSLHPITVVTNELVDLFTSLGFSWQDGPEIESDFFNFQALNSPDDHPAAFTF